MKIRRIAAVVSACLLFNVPGLVSTAVSADTPSDLNAAADSQVFAYQEQILAALGYKFVDESIDLTDGVNGMSNAQLETINSNEYAGLYIDSNQNIVVNFINNSQSLKKATKLGNENNGKLKNNVKNKSQNLKIKGVEHSYNDLNLVMATLTSLMQTDYRDIIITSSADVINNRIDVGIRDEGNDTQKTENSIVKYLKNNIEAKISNKTIKDILSFNVLSQNDIPTACASTVNGYSLLHYTSGSSVCSFTVTCGFYSSTYGAGLLSCGHDMTVGATVYNSSNVVVGTIKKVAFSGKNDSSFIQLASGVTFAPEAPQISEALSGQTPAVGSVVTQRGGKTGHSVTGTVGSNNVSITVSTTLPKAAKVTITNEILTNGVMQSGDSGGALIGVSIDGGRTKGIIGSLTAGSGLYSYFENALYVVGVF